MSQTPEVETQIRLEELRRELGSVGEHRPLEEPKGEIIYQNPNATGDIQKPQESGSQLRRLVVYWDLKDREKADKYGHLPGDYLFIFPVRKGEVSDDDIHKILNNMKGKMHYICAQKIGYSDHAVTFIPTCYYPKEEALVVRVEPEETILSPSSISLP